MNSDMDRPKAYHHGDLRNALIQAGLDVLARQGAAALDLRKVARKAGVSHAAPYRHFADKQALIAALIEVGFQRLHAQIDATLRDVPGDVEAQLQGLARAYVHFAQDNPWLMREMFSGLTIDRESFPSVYQAAKTVYTQFVTVVGSGQAHARIRAGDPGELASVVWSLLHGMATLVLEQQTRPYTDEPAGVERLIRVCVQMLYEGLSAR